MSVSFLHPIGSGCHRLQGVVVAAETLPVGDIVEGAAVLTLLDVVSEETGRGDDSAALAIGGAFTSIPGTLQDGTTPGLMRSGAQFGIDLLDWR